MPVIYKSSGATSYYHDFVFAKNKTSFKVKAKRANVVLGNIKNSSLISLAPNIDSKQDLKFRKFIENKKIVIVSPKLVDSKDGYKIDKADIVIRTNYIKGDPIIKGSRVDISYFNLETTEHIIENGFSKWPAGISWIVARTLGQVESIFKRLTVDEIKIEHLNGRSLERVDKALFYGSLTVVQNIIVDLLRYNPKEIFLYHFDIMLSKERINGYYPKINNKNDFRLKMIKSFPGHDPVINFQIMKSFWKQDFIKGDQRFEEVMKMDTKDYMKNMQKVYYLDNSFEIN